MPIDQSALTNYLEKLLTPNIIKDYAPNGLQIDSHKKSIETIITGVSASSDLIEEAVKLNADAILVHHGLFFKGEPKTITSWKFKRIEKLIKNDISLYAYHLPLDIHPIYGNNVQLAKLLELNVTGTFETGTELPLGVTTELTTSASIDDFSKTINEKLNHQPLVINSQSTSNIIKTIGICTGAAQDFISFAKDAKLDAYLSGEISERTTHLAKELGIHYLACGHHATERYGIQALGEHLSNYFDIKHRFIDIANPA